MTGVYHVYFIKKIIGIFFSPEYLLINAKYELRKSIKKNEKNLSFE